MVAFVVAALVFSWLTATCALKLESFSAPNVELNALPETAKALVGSDTWWALVGERLFYAPHSMLQLSSNSSEYFYARGAESGLTPELKARRVGGDSGWHIFHFPDGSPLDIHPAAGGRRSSISSLAQLHSGMSLGNRFPAFVTSAAYKSPLSASGRTRELSAASKINKDVIQQYLEHITSLPSRSYSNPNASKAAMELVSKSFKDMNYTVCLHALGNGYSGVSNVVAYMPGTDETAHDTVTVGAHYDSRPFYGAAPGAEDNGSGLAALLAIAKAFAATQVKPQRTVYFVGFAAEEAGMRGSSVFAKDLKEGGGDIPTECLPAYQRHAKSNTVLQLAKKGMKGHTFLQLEKKRLRELTMQGLPPTTEGPTHQAIIMDEVGWLSPKLSPDRVLNLESYDWTKDLCDHLADASSTHNGANLTIVHSSNPFGSDHMSWLERDMPSVLLINGDDEAYPDYHMSTDTIDHVDMEYVSQIAKVALGGAMRTAGLIDAPV